MDWNSSALWGIIGLIGGFFFSFVFYILSNKNKKIEYIKNSQILIANNLSEIEGLAITYQNQPIKNLTSTTITMTSVGKDIINMNDFGKATPLCIKTTGKFFLQSDINSIIFKNSNSKNLLTPIVENETTILLNFDYLSKQDEIVFIILHTEDIYIDGKLKSGSILYKNNNKNSSFFSLKNVYWLIGFIFLSESLAIICKLNVEFKKIIFFAFWLGLFILFTEYVAKFFKKN